MNRDELLKKYNVEAPKGKTIAEILQDRQTQKVNNYIQSYNNAINKYGNLSKTDLTKYGDYSGTKQSFSDLYEEIGTLKTNLNSIKGYISEKNYDQIFKSLTDIQGTVKSNIEVTQNAIDFYGKFENEESYNLAIEYSKADLDSLKTEITNLEAGYNAAKALQENINAYTNRANVYRKRSNGLTTDGGNQKRADSYKAQLKQLLAKYGYSSLSEFEKAISSKQSFYNNAFEMQNTQRISEVSNPESKYYDPEFDKFSQVGKIVYSSISLKAKQTINGAARTGSVEYFNNLKKTSEYYDKILHRFDIAHMTEDEKEIFYYYVGKFAQQANRGNVDVSIINDYVDTIQAAINYKSAVKINEKLKDNKIAQYALGAYAGISNFTENVENAFDTSGKKKTASNIEIASQINREKNLADDGFSFWYNIKTGKWEGKILGNSLGQIAYDLMNTTAYMAPSMIVSNIPVVGKGLGLAITGLAAYGGAYQEKINEGYTKKQARTYGVLVGTSEATLQYLIGGISKLGGKFSKKAITNLVDKVDNAFAKVALEIELSSNSEALEEGMQTFLEPLFHTIATGETFESAKWNDVLYSALLGKLNSYALESGPVIQNATNETLVGNAIVSKGEVDNVLLAAASIGKLDPEIAGQVDALTKYAKKHNGAVNNATYKRMLGKVAVAIAQNSTDVKQNIIESAIKSALSKRGIDGKVLSKIINAVSKYITGQRLTSAEQGFIKNNSVAGELIREIAAAQKVVNSEASQKADMMNETAITENGENNTTSTAVSGGAPEWAVTLVRQLNLIDGATEIVNAAVTGKTKEEAKTQERNRMIKLLSIASGKTTAQQEAEAGDIPYSQYIKQKEAAAKKENTAENSGEDSNGSDIEISEADRKKQAERKEKVKSLCDLFGLSLEWDEEIKRGKYNPKNRMVSLNPNLTLTEMYIEVLKHEFTHDLENRRLYKGFKEFLFGKSINFRDYCETALKNDYGEELKGDEAIKRLTQLKYRDYMSSDEMSDEEKAAFDNEAAEREIVADFVANRLLGGIGTDGKFEQEAYEALKELSEYHRSGFQRFVDWIKELINKIKGQPTFKDMADELEYLNKQIAKVYDSKVNSTSNSTIEKHSIVKNIVDTNGKEYGPGVLLDTNIFDGTKPRNWGYVLKDYLTNRIKNKGTFIMPIIDENGDVQNLQFARLNERVSKNEGNSHKVVEKLWRNKSNISKLSVIHINEIIDVSEEDIPYSTDLNSHGWLDENGWLHRKAYVVDNKNHDIYEIAIDIAITNDKRFILYALNGKTKNVGNADVNSLSENLMALRQNTYKNTVPQSAESVKENSDSTESHSIAVPFSEEFKAEKRKKYAEGLVKKYGGDINGAELENYLKEISIAADNNSYSEALKIAHKMAQYISENSAKGIQKTVHKNKIKEIFNSFFSENKVVGNRAELEGRLSKAVELLMESKTDTENEQALSEADSIIEDLARELVEAPDENSEEYKRLQDIKNVLSMARIKITDEIENGDFKDGFADFRRRNRGKIWLSKSGVDLNEVYEELTSEFGEELFPSNIEGAVEKLSRISEVINARFGADGSLLEGTDEAVESIKNEIHSAVDKIIEDTLDDENVKPEDNLAEKLFDMAVYDRTEEVSYKAREAQKKISEKKNRKFTNATKQRFADMDKTVDEIVKAELEARENRQDRQKNIEAIRKTVNSLYKKLTTNSNTKHIPEGFKWAVMDICEIFYRSDLTVFDRRDFHTLSSMYDKVSKESKGEGLDTESVFDEEISEMIRTIADAIDGKRLNQLNSVQVAVLRNIIDNINHIVNEEDKIRIAGKKYETETLGREAIKDFSGKKRVANLPLIEGSRNFLKYNNLSPVYFFENVGDTLKKLYDEIRHGMDKVAYNLDYTKNYITDVKEKYNYDSWKNETVELDTEYGGKLTLSIEQAMQLYATAKRELTNKTQESRHIFAGGIVFESKDLKERLKNISKSNKKSEIINELLVDEMADTAINITLSDITALSTKLSDEQIEYVNSIVKYMSENMAALGNETSLELYGIRKFNEDYYIPYKTSDDYLATQPGYKPPKTHQSASFTKNTVKKASTPIVIEGFSNVAAKHCNQMIMYNALTVPLNNLTKIYNFNQNVGAEDERSQSLKSLISTTMGTGANKYIEQFIKDMNGDARIAVGEEASNKLLRIFKANAVMASASVVIQQPASIGRAIAYIEPKYFFGVKNGKGDYEQLKKYCGAAIFKEMGRFDTGLGAGTTDWLLQTKPKGVKNKLSAFVKNEQGYRDDAFSYAASKADEITWSTIWRAAKNKVAAETNLKVDSEEFLIEAGKLVSEVIDKTQVYDSTISRSQIMRSNSPIVKMATAFMAEPTVTLNMLYDAAKDFSSKNYKKGLSKVSAVAVTAVLTALLKSLVTAARDDDEYKSYLEKYLSDFATETIDNLLPFNMLPYIRDIYSIIQGYDVKRSDMEAIDTLVSAAKSLFDAEESIGKKFDTFLDALGAFIGIPYKNISRDFMAVFNTGKSFIEGENKTTWDGIWYAILEDLPIGTKKDSKSVNYDRLLNAAESGDKEKFDKVKDHLEELGEDDAAIKSGLKKSIKKNSDEYQDDFQDYMNKLYRIAFFDNLSAEEKKKVENNISNFVAEEIVTDIIGEEPEKKGEKKKTDPYDKVREAENKGIGAEYYYLSKVATGVDNADTDGSGTVSKKEKLKAIRNMNISNDIKAALIALYK